MSVLYLCSYVLKYATTINVAINKNKISRQDFWIKLVNLNPNDIETLKEIYETFYWLNSGKDSLN